jgi:hypothetical protein
VLVFAPYVEVLSVIAMATLSCEAALPVPIVTALVPVAIALSPNATDDVPVDCDDTPIDKALLPDATGRTALFAAFSE